MSDRSSLRARSVSDKGGISHKRRLVQFGRGLQQLGRATDERVARTRPPLLGTLLILIGLFLLAVAAMGAAAIRLPAEPPASQVAVGAAPPPPLQALSGATPTREPTPTSITEETPAPTPVRSVPEPATPTAEPAPTPKPKMPPPTRIQIPSVGIDAPVVEVGYKIVDIEGVQAIEWEVAEYAAGHHNTSANPGEGGNIVISGHNDWKGEVFRTLEHVQLGDEVILTSDAGVFRYRVVEIHYRKEVGVPLEERLATGRFLDPMPEERVTLVTCWPYGIDDHRIIVVAKPVD